MKSFTHLALKQVGVQWILLLINHHVMVHVQLVLSMVQQVLYLIFHVQIGLMTMESKIIPFMVCVHILSEWKTDFVVWLAWTDDPSEQTIVAFSSVSIFQVRLPAGDDQTSLLHLIVQIRDTLDCITEYNMSSLTVLPDSVGINDLINDIQSSSGGITTNPIVQLLASGNQNIVGQMISSLSQQFNKMNQESLNEAVLGKSLDNMIKVIFILFL